MPEINLPTATKQDSIKADTQSILSKFPIKGGTDFNTRSLFVTGSGSPPDATTLIVDVSGKGILHFVGHNSTTTNTSVKIAIDGGTPFLLWIRPGVQYPLVAGFNSNLKIYGGTISVIEIAYSLE